MGDTNLKEESIKVLKKFEHPVYQIDINMDIVCTCLSETNGKPSPKCEKCLGTGHKIKIKKIPAAKLDTDIPTTIRTNGDFKVISNFYVRADFPIKERDLIIDNNESFTVFKIKNVYGYGGELIYRKCLVPDIYANQGIIVENFKKIMKKKDKNQ